MAFKHTASYNSYFQKNSVLFDICNNLFKNNMSICDTDRRIAFAPPMFTFECPAFHGLRNQCLQLLLCKELYDLTYIKLGQINVSEWRIRYLGRAFPIQHKRFLLDHTPRYLFLVIDAGLLARVVLREHNPIAIHFVRITINSRESTVQILFSMITVFIFFRMTTV